jgi:hypothetical protein
MIKTLPDALQQRLSSKDFARECKQERGPLKLS